VVIHADSSYLIDLLREQARGKRGHATAFLEQHAADHLAASVFVVCELEAGAANATSTDREQARLRALIEVLTVVYPDERFAPVYGDALVKLQRTGKTVATMDLLIATAAVVDSAALVTANRRHFDMIPGLDVLGYRDAAR
jgi:predicted nucleic acid-binding protein